MKFIGVSLVAFLLAAAGTAEAKGKAKGKVKAAKVVEHEASTAEVGKLKGEYKWGMNAEEVVAVVEKRIAERYEEKLKKSSGDPAKQDRLKTAKRGELNEVKKSFVKFEGTKGGWDVSIVDQEFGHGSGEALLVNKEEQWTRYFFFFEDKLYKMFLAFDKDLLRGKNFDQFGGEMQKKFGSARLVMREEKAKAGARKVPDYYLWASANADSLRLVDRSTFYDVYCLVVYDGSTQDRVAERRKVVAPSAEAGDSLVDAVTKKDENNRDANDNIIDRITGRNIAKPGDEPKHADIVVPSVRGPSAAEVNASSESSGDNGGKKTAGKKGEKKGEKKDDKPSGLDGLEL